MSDSAKAPEAQRVEPIKVRICDRDHPHWPERGVLTGEMVMLFGQPMAKMALSDCQHGTAACLVSKGQVCGDGVRARRSSAQDLEWETMTLPEAQRAERPHCWHVVSSSTDGMGERGYDSEICCHCAKQRKRHWRWVPDPKHGPHGHPPKIRKLVRNV